MELAVGGVRSTSPHGNFCGIHFLPSPLHQVIAFSSFTSQKDDLLLGLGQMQKKTEKNKRDILLSRSQDVACCMLLSMRATIGPLIVSLLRSDSIEQNIRETDIHTHITGDWLHCGCSCLYQWQSHC